MVNRYGEQEPEPEPERVFYKWDKVADFFYIPLIYSLYFCPRGSITIIENFLKTVTFFIPLNFYSFYYLHFQSSNRYNLLIDDLYRAQ